MPATRAATTARRSLSGFSDRTCCRPSSPLPVRLTHDVSPPLDPGNRAVARRGPAALDALHARVGAECQTFLDAAVARRERGAPCTDRLLRGVERVLQAVGV